MHIIYTLLIFSTCLLYIIMLFYAILRYTILYYTIHYYFIPCYAIYSYPVSYSCRCFSSCSLPFYMIKHINKFLCSGSVLISGLFYPRERENPRQTIASGHIPVKQLADSNDSRYRSPRDIPAGILTERALLSGGKAWSWRKTKPG